MNREQRSVGKEDRGPKNMVGCKIMTERKALYSQFEGGQPSIRIECERKLHLGKGLFRNDNH